MNKPKMLEKGRGQGKTADLVEWALEKMLAGDKVVLVSPSMEHQKRLKERFIRESGVVYDKERLHEVASHIGITFVVETNLHKLKGMDIDCAGIDDWDLLRSPIRVVVDVSNDIHGGEVVCTTTRSLDDFFDNVNQLTGVE